MESEFPPQTKRPINSGVGISRAKVRLQGAILMTQPSGNSKKSNFQAPMKCTTLSCFEVANVKSQTTMKCSVLEGVSHYCVVSFLPLVTQCQEARGKNEKWDGAKVQEEVAAGSKFSSARVVFALRPLPHRIH